MKENPNKSQLTLIECAMQSGLTMGLWFGVNFIVGASPKMGWLQIIVQAIIFLRLIFSAVQYKQKVLGGEANFQQLYSYGLCLFVCASLVASIIRLIYLLWIDPDFLERLFEQALQTIGQMNISSEQMKAVSASIEDLRKPTHFVINYLMADTIVGAIVTLLTSLIARRVVVNIYVNKNGQDEDNE